MKFVIDMNLGAKWIDRPAEAGALVTVEDDRVRIRRLPSAEIE